MRMAEELQLGAADRSALFYALLLKDVGCSSNAAKISYLFGADDHQVKNSIRLTDWTSAGENLKNCWRQCTPEGSTLERLLQMAALVRSGIKGAKKLSQTRCERGASIARCCACPPHGPRHSRPRRALGRSWASARPALRRDFALGPRLLPGPNGRAVLHHLRPAGGDRRRRDAARHLVRSRTGRHCRIARGRDLVLGAAHPHGSAGRAQSLGARG